MRPFTAALVTLLLAAAARAQVENTGPTGYTPTVAEASEDGERAIARIIKPAGFEIQLFAAEPMLANPVAFYIDHLGRFYVAETFRHHAGVTDMREHRSWLVDDLAARTVEERRVTMERNLGDAYPGYSVEHDRIRQIVDTDGDGRADRATVFADGFNDAMAGIGAGLLVDRGNVYFTCIPELWKLRDEDNDGHADSREIMSEGYGVHINFLGHDLHGLRKGPDGRLYFSIGDRGFSTLTQEGELLDYPDTGAVLRCFPDGSGLEVVHFGLRNPQELAFDAYGNLFTGDNNSDGGDQARWVYLVDGGDSGWTIGWQWITSPNPRGPWNSEQMWHPYHEGQPAHMLPPLANIGAGPSGLTYYPGTGMPAKYDNTFFMCDFRGNPVGSVIHAIQLKPNGAAFEVASREDFVSEVLATDCDFGVEGGLYLTDWVAGWDKPQRGRIYRVVDPATENDPLVAETKKLLAKGFAQRSDTELVKLLGHADMRVRSEAQYALADRGADMVPLFIEATNSVNEFTRLHGVWGLWQLVLAGDMRGVRIVPLLSHKDPAVRAQAARVLGEVASGIGQAELLEALIDPEPRVRFFSAIALGAQGKKDPGLAEGLLSLLAENNNADPYIRHAGVMGLLGCAEEDQLASLSDADYPSAVRLAGLLALRRLQSPEAARFLNDRNPFIVTEAVRAIHDAPIVEALPDLAALADSRDIDWTNEPVARRILNANYRLGKTANGSVVTRVAANPDLPNDMREEAIRDLAEWTQPPALDRVNGMWRPLPERSSSLPRTEVAELVPRVIENGTRDLRLAAIELAAAQNLTTTDNLLEDVAKSDDFSSGERIAAIQALAALESPRLDAAIETALDSDSALVRLEGIAQLAKLNPAAAVPMLDEVAKSGNRAERQAAIAALGTVDAPDGEKAMLEWIEQLQTGRVQADMQTDIVMAAEGSPMASVRESIAEWDASFTDPDAIDPWLVALEGGDIRRGREIFNTKIETQCLRCHQIGTQGGSEVGPNLSDIGSRVTRPYILESIVFPNNAIAEGFQNVIITLEDGEEYAGRVIEETDDALVLELGASEAGRLELTTNPHSIVDVVAENSGEARTQVSFPKDNIDDRLPDLSSMPDNHTEFLTLAELRDLVEFLATRR